MAITTPFAAVEEAIEDVRAGRFVVVVDDPDRENEGDLVIAFTITFEAREGVTTGISAADRSHTIQVAIAPDSGPGDLVSPGHMHGLRARPGGVLERIGQTEASVDLARLAGLNPAGVVCEIMNDDGTMARVPDLVPYCERHGLKMITVADLIEYRKRTEKLVERVVSVRLRRSTASS